MAGSVVDRSRLYEALPRGRNALPPHVAEAYQRARIADTAARLIGQHGFGSVRLADIVKAAGVSRTTFYDNFKDKQACFLAAYDEMIDALVDAVERAGAAANDPAAGIRAAFSMYLRWVEADPVLTRAYLIEIYAAGLEGLDRRDRSQQRLSDLAYRLHRRARRLHPDLPEVSRDGIAALVGGTNELVYGRLRAGRPERLADLRVEVGRLQDALLGPMPA
jgi:AcrR family transcriptional regulator